MTEEIVRNSDADDTVEEYKKDFSFGYKELNVANAVLFVSFTLIFTFIFIFIWECEVFREQAYRYILDAKISVPALLAGIIINEIIKALTFLVLTDIKLKNLKYGINYLNITPYVHCKHAIKLNTFRTTTFTTVFVMVFAPAITCIITGFYPLIIFNAIFLIISGSDIFTLWKTRALKGNLLVTYHAERAGVSVYENPFE